MGINLAERLKAPTFDDEERTRVARVLHVVFLLLFGTMATIFVLRVALTGLDGHWFVYPLLLAVTLTLLAALRRGYVYTSGLVMALAYFTYGVLGVLSSGGLHSPTVQMLTFVVMFGALLGSSRIVIGLTGACIAALIGVAAIELSGHLPPAIAQHTTTSIFFGQVASILMVGIFLNLIIVSLKDALQRARDNERAAGTMAREAEDARGLVADIIESMAESVIVLDSSAQIRSINAATTALLGFESRELVGAPLDRVLVGERSTLETLRSPLFTHSERVYRTRDGGRVPVRFSTALLRGDGELVRGVVCVASDIRDEKEVEQRLRRAKELAEEASAAKSRFLANMSHELRTPLNAVIGYTELIIEEASERGLTRSVDDLRRIQGAGKHLLGLIADILDISKVEAGKVELHFATFDINDMVQSVLDGVRPLVERKGLALVTDVPAGLGFFHSDQTKLRQILLNLLGNAAKFTEEGEVSLTVRRRDGGERLVFVVRDTGIGMSKSHVGQLFEAFTQPDAEVVRRYGGTGLGLALSRAYAEMLGGSIDVRSALGEGSEFTVSLPVSTS